MERINQPDAPGGRFTDGDAGAGTPGTIVGADHLNAVQDELLQVITDAGLTPNGADLTQISQAISRLSVSTGGLTNRVINGTMQVWQRGDSFNVTPDPIYTADRWEVESDGSGGAGRGTVTRGYRAFQTGTLPGIWDYLRYTPTVPADQGGPAIRQKIEALRELSDRAVNVSFVARSTEALQVTVRVIQRGYGQNLVVTSQTIDIGTTWERHSFSFNAPALPDAAPGTSPHLEVEIRIPNLATAVVDLARVQVEEGAVETTFEERELTLEALLCRRYFQKTYQLDTAPGSPSIGDPAVLANDVNVEAFRAIRFEPQMRAIPTVTWYSNQTAGRITWNGVLRTVTGMSVTTTASMGIPLIAGGYPTVLGKAVAHYTADAEI
jgi:hypothetical protein